MARVILKVILLTVLSFAFCISQTTRDQDSGSFRQLRKNPGITVISDITLIDSPIGDSDLVNVLVNRRLGRYAINYMANRLGERGDSIARINLSTIGLLSIQKKYHVISSQEELEIPIRYLEFQEPPFYVDDAFRRDTLALPLLRSVFTALLAGEKYNTVANSVIPAAAVLGQSLGGTTLCVFLLRGYCIGVAGEYGSDPVGRSGATTIIAARRASQYSISCFFIDGKTGTVLWNGKIQISGGDLSENRLTDMLDDMIDRIPSE